MLSKKILIICMLFCCSSPFLGYGQAIPVTVEISPEGKWQLMRAGQPYYIQGVGGDDYLEKALAIGANSIRTWSPDNAQDVLDAAQKLGMTVTMGLWVQHERHGYDYNNKEKVQAQLEYFTSIVQKYKDHPALLMWGVGNEVDLFYSNTKVWDAVEDIAAMIHQLDPNHPTTTITAGLDAEEVRLIKEKAPSIDIYGINTYGDIGKVPALIRSAGWEGPYIIAEWGPTGHWEVKKTRWDAPVEQSSTEKATTYRNRYQQYIAGDADKCIGSYVFLWGQKQETTATWYGMFSNEGYSSEAVDVLEQIWTGKKPANSAPMLDSASLNQLKKGEDIILTANQKWTATAWITDPDGDRIKYEWEVVNESQDIKSGGDAESRPPAVKGLGMKKKGNTVTFRAPAEEGPYRLFLFAYDGNDHYAYTNIPFYVLPAENDEDGKRPVSFKKVEL